MLIRRWRTARPLIASAMLALPVVAQGVDAQTPNVPRDNPGRRQQYLYRQRALPFERIPPGAIQKARREKESRWAKRGMFSAQAVGNGWTAVGPNNLNYYITSSGRLTAIAVHPTIPTTIFAGGAQGGVWKSVNGGTNWTPVTDDQCSLAMGHIAIDPVNPDIIYAGTGELHSSIDSYYGCGVLRSTDGGATWQQLGASVFDIPTTNFGGMFISKVVIDRISAGTPTTTTVFVATNRGIYKSTNSGIDWTVLTNGIPSGAGAIMSDMVADPATANVYYAAMGRFDGHVSNGVYKTVDGGISWVKLTSLPSNTSVGRIQLTISRSSPNILYTAIHSPANTHELLGIWKTTNGGTSWTPVTATGVDCGNQCWYNMHIAVHPLGPDTVYFGGFSLYKSTNGGAAFIDVGGPIHVDHHAFAFDPVDPRIIYSGNDGGIYKSTNGGGTWASLNTEIAIHQFYPGFSLHPTNPNRMMGGSQDNGTTEYNGTLSWLHVVGGDGGFTAIDHITGNTAWAETQWDPNTGGPRRRDAPSGGGFLSRRSGINMSDSAEFIPPLVMDPVNPRVLYFGTNRLYRTRDNGESWTPISVILSGNIGNGITAIAVARSDTNVVYVGTSDGRVQVTANAGGSYTLGAGLPNPSRYVTDLAVDPINASVAYVTLSGFGTPHVYRTVDRGVTWQSISSNLPDMPVNAIVIQPGVEIDIGTDLGLFRTTNGGTSWDPFPGIPNVAVFDLAFNPVTQLLVAATHGRGAFKYTVPAVLALRGDVTADNAVSALDAQAVLSATVGLTLPTGWKPNSPNGDANCDGTAPTASDAQIILSFVVGLNVSSFCVGKFQ